MRNDFVAFILTHGRPDRVHTLTSLLRHGYTGKWFIIIDNEDKTADQYREAFGDRVIMFDKAAIAKTFDEGDNFQDRRAIVYARNACFGIAKELGVQYFIQLDDDYTQFQHRRSSSEEIIAGPGVKGLDAVFDGLVRYLERSKASSLAIAQGGDFIGGRLCSTWKEGFYPHRKCMNTFVCATDRPFQFVGRINEDVNTYTAEASRGRLFFTIPNVAIVQMQTQGNAGGMTDIYLDQGTYVKSFYTVMYHPSGTKIAMMGNGHRRLHHSIAWNNTTPMILDEKHRKETGAKNAKQ